MTRPTPCLYAAPTLSASGHRCYYWVCASIMMDAGDRSDVRVMERVNAALSCAQSHGCVRADDCRELTLGALARLLQQRPRG